MATHILKNIDYIQGDITILNSNKPLNILWGVQPRDLPGLEFLIPIMQIVKFIKSGHFITILIADIHELLESPNLDINTIQYRGKAYVKLIQLLLELFNANPYCIDYKFSSEFQLSSEYVMDFYKICSLATISDTFKSIEIDNISNDNNSISTSNKKMTSIIYPVLQSLNEKYINYDIFYGSITQINMCKYSEKLMNNDKNYDKKILYLLQDLTTKVKISFFDPLDTIQLKLECFTEEELDYLCIKILIPLLKLRDDKTFWLTNTTEIIAKMLSKHLNQFYDKLLDSDFSKLYYSGWN